MELSKKAFDEVLQFVSDELCAITEEGNHTILQVTHTPNSKTYQVSIFPNKTKPYDDDDTRD